MTIYALSTAPGRAAIAVIRVSGPQTVAAVEALTGRPPPKPRQAALRQLSHPQDNTPLDEGLVLFFAAPQSYTGEDMAEFHVHGGVSVVRSVLAALAEMDGLSPAEPGGFTRLAVLNGRFDLTRAEGIADLIDAETEAQQNQAFRQMRGALGALYDGWRGRLVKALAHLEADIEFADEDLPGGIGKAVLADMQLLSEEIEAHLAQTRGQTLRDGIEVAIIGAPNVGKSSLLNRLAGREAAIVSARAGTTRDIVEVTMTLGGVPVVVADTAGIRAAGDEIEREGVRRARKRAADADIRLFVSSPDVDATFLQENALHHESGNENGNAEPPGDGLEVVARPGDFHIANKIDLQKPAANSAGSAETWRVSAKNGEGLPAFMAALEKAVQNRYGLSEHPLLTRTRYRQALEAALIALHRALAASDLELVGEDMRLAMRELGRITGAVDVEALLDVVFRDFCIGK